MPVTTSIEELEHRLEEAEKLLQENKVLIQELTTNYAELAEQLKKEFPKPNITSEIVMPTFVPLPQAKPKESAQTFFMRDFVEFPDIYSEFKKGLETAEEIFKANCRDKKFQVLVAKRCRGM